MEPKALGWIVGALGALAAIACGRSGLELSDHDRNSDPDASTGGAAGATTVEPSDAGMDALIDAPDSSSEFPPASARWLALQESLDTTLVRVTPEGFDEPIHLVNEPFLGWSPDGRWMAVGGYTDVALIRVNDDGPANPIVVATEIRDFSWSPTLAIAVVADLEHRHWQIIDAREEVPVVRDLDLGNPTPQISLGHMPVWAPDGMRVVLPRCKSGQQCEAHLLVAAAKLPEPEPLHTNLIWMGEACNWSIGGRWLACSGDAPEQSFDTSEVYVFDTWFGPLDPVLVDGSETWKDLYATTFPFAYGDSLLFQTPENAELRYIHAAYVAAGETKLLEAPAPAEGDRALSPDGRRFVYSGGCGSAGSTALCLREFGLDGPTAAQPLDEGTFHQPRWSPNGRYLQYQGSDLNQPLRLVDLDNLQPTPLDIPNAKPGTWAGRFSPDSRWLEYEPANAKEPSFVIWRLGSSDAPMPFPEGEVYTWYAKWASDSRSIAVVRYHTEIGTDLYARFVNGNELGPLFTRFLPDVLGPYVHWQPVPAS